jgi:hypothetical protein
VSPRATLAFLKLIDCGVSVEQAADLAYGQRGVDIVTAFRTSGITI